MNAIAERMPFEQYVELPEAHATGLINLLASPKLYRHREDHGRPDKDTFRTGRAGHTAILEPDRFLLDYVLWDSAKDGKRDMRVKKYADFCAMHAGKTIITRAQYECAMRMRDAVGRHPVASRLLAEKGRSELVLRWTHPSTGIACKARVDRLTSCLIDIKSTRDVSQTMFSNAAARYGYAFQLAFYRDGVIVTHGTTLPTKIIAVQNCEPFDVVVYNLPAQTLALGNEQIEKAMTLLAECIASGKWPGVAEDDEVDLTLPSWATMSAEDDEPITFGSEVLQ